MASQIGSQSPRMPNFTYLNRTIIKGNAQNAKAAVAFEIAVHFPKVAFVSANLKESQNLSGSKEVSRVGICITEFIRRRTSIPPPDPKTTIISYPFIKHVIYYKNHSRDNKNHELFEKVESYLTQLFPNAQRIKTESYRLESVEKKSRGSPAISSNSQEETSESKTPAPKTVLKK